MTLELPRTAAPVPRPQARLGALAPYTLQCCMMAKLNEKAVRAAISELSAPVEALDAPRAHCPYTRGPRRGTAWLISTTKAVDGPKTQLKQIEIMIFPSQIICAWSVIGLHGDGARPPARCATWTHSFDLFGYPGAAVLTPTPCTRRVHSAPSTSNRVLRRRSESASRQAGEAPAARSSPNLLALPRW